MQWCTKYKKIVHIFRHTQQVMDIVMNSNNTFWTSIMPEARLWDLRHKNCILKVTHKQANYIYLFLQNAKLYSNAYGPFIFVYDMKKAED